MGDYAKAELKYKQALEVLKLTLGEDHPSYATVLDNLADVYMKWVIICDRSSLHRRHLR